MGNDLTGATSVTFNGLPALFTVKTPDYIETGVPYGAGSGTVQVTLASGKIVTSNVAFQVTR